LPTTGLTGNFRIQAEEPDEYEKRRYLWSREGRASVLG
jgi:hypothetical protein